MFRLTHKTLNGLAALSLLALGCTSTSAPPPGDADAAEPLEVSESRTEETSTGDDIDALEPPADIHDSTDGWEALSACDGAYGEPLETLKLPGTKLLEISGLVSSRLNSGVFWAHNDSGALPELWAFSTDGLQTRLNVTGAQAYDWEDMARASCPGGDSDCLWVADMGNNLKNREELSVIVIREPKLNGESEVSASPEAIYTFSYPDDTMDAEALLVTPAGDRFFVLEKSDGDTARVFSSPEPLTTEGVMTLIELTTFDSPGEPIPYGKMVTAADLHPSGERLAVRCYTGSWEYRFMDGQGLEHLGEITPTFVALGPLEEPQGEAIAYGAAGLDLYTASEDPNALGSQPLHRYPCLP